MEFYRFQAYPGTQPVELLEPVEPLEPWLSERSLHVSEDRVVHLRRQHTGVRVLSRWMVRADEREAIVRPLRAVCECRSRAWQRFTLRGEELQPRVPRDLAQRDHDLQLTQV